MKKIFYTLILIISGASSTIACSCLTFTSFCELVTENTSVVLAKVVEKYDDGEFKRYMDVQIEQVIQGSVSASTLSIVDHGTSCDLFHDGFAIGDQLILTGIDETRIDPFSGHPFLSPGGCSESLLTLQNGWVRGVIQEEINQQSFEDFKANIGDCVNNLGDIDFLFRVFPNPVFDEINVLASTNNLDLPVQYELFDASGRSLQIGTSETASFQINTTNYPIGVYMLRISINEGKQNLVKRIVKW